MWWIILSILTKNGNLYKEKCMMTMAFSRGDFIITMTFSGGGVF